MPNNVKVFTTVVGILVVGVIGLALMRGGSGVSGPGKYDTFAKCLKDQGAIFYGAFWCPHCQSQKKLFGSSQKYLPYVECSTADGGGQTEECIDQKITGYPTWEFADGTRVGGEVSLENLAQKTSCVLPVEGANVQ